MGVMGKVGAALLGKPVVDTVQAAGEMLDGLFTSTEERLDKQAMLERVRQQPQLLQGMVTKIEASHRSVFVAGWRPFIGWVCGVNLLYLVLIRDWILWTFTVFHPELPAPPAVGLDLTVELVAALLGLGTLRTVEKMNGKAA